MNMPRERGAVLLMSLIMLVMMTIFVVSSVNVSSLGMKVVGNAQSQKQVDAAAMEAVEVILNDFGNFNKAVSQRGAPTAAATCYFSSGSCTPTDGLATVSPVGSAAGYSVTVNLPTCISSQTATGYSAVWGLAPDDNIWEISTTVSDNVTGATSTITQGVRIRMLAGNCPAGGS